jgi:hypothetical protein
LFCRSVPFFFLRFSICWLVSSFFSHNGQNSIYYARQ